MPDLTAPTRGHEPPQPAIVAAPASTTDRRSFRRLLVAFDGSWHARRALDAAIELARANDGTLTVITVASDPSFSGLVGASRATLDTEELSARIERGHRLTLDRAAEAVPDGVPVTKILRHGAPAAAIIAAAERGQHDLIVMGSRGRGSPHGPLGSVCDQVLQAAPVSVLIAAPSTDDRPASSHRDPGLPITRQGPGDLTPPDSGSRMAGPRSDHV